MQVIKRLAVASAVVAALAAAPVHAATIEYTFPNSDTPTVVDCAALNYDDPQQNFVGKKSQYSFWTDNPVAAQGLMERCAQLEHPAAAPPPAVLGAAIQPMPTVLPKTGSGSGLATLALASVIALAAMLWHRRAISVDFTAQNR